MKNVSYLSPDMTILEITSEGILCASTTSQATFSDEWKDNGEYSIF